MNKKKVGIIISLSIIISIIIVGFIIFSSGNDSTSDYDYDVIINDDDIRIDEIVSFEVLNCSSKQVKWIVDNGQELIGNPIEISFNTSGIYNISARINGVEIFNSTLNVKNNDIQYTDSGNQIIDLRPTQYSNVNGIIEIHSNLENPIVTIEANFNGCYGTGGIEFDIYDTINRRFEVLFWEEDVGTNDDISFSHTFQPDSFPLVTEDTIFYYELYIDNGKTNSWNITVNITY